MRKYLIGAGILLFSVVCYASVTTSVSNAIQGMFSDGSNLARPVLVSGTNGTVNKALKTDSNGQLIVSNLPASGLSQDSANSLFVDTSTPKATYSANFFYTAATSATDTVCLKGSATKTVRVTFVDFDWSVTSQINTFLIKRTSADTGGTSTSPTAAVYDSNDAAATATVLMFTANPGALGSGTAIAGAQFSSNGSGSTYSPFMKVFGARPAKAIVLRGVNEWLCVNANGETPASLSVNGWFEWTEE